MAGLKGAHYYLLVLRPLETKLAIHPYTRSELSQATEEYLAQEKLIQDEPASQAVLVAADSLSALKRLYPNYFLDTTVFLDTLVDAIG